MTAARVPRAETLLDVTALRGGKLSITFTESPGTRVRVRTLRGHVGRRLSGPFTLGSVGDPGDGRVIVATDRGGGQLMATSDLSRVALYRRSAGARFRRAGTLASRGTPVSVDDLVIGPRGDALVLWNRDHGTKTVYRYALRAAGGHFGRARTLMRAPQAASDPVEPVARAAIGARGRLIVGLVLFGDGRGTGVYASAGSLAAGLAPPVRLSRSYSIPDAPDTPRPVVYARGRGAFAWQAEQHVAVARYQP